MNPGQGNKSKNKKGSKGGKNEKKLMKEKKYKNEKKYKREKKSKEKKKSVHQTPVVPVTVVHLRPVLLKSMSRVLKGKARLQKRLQTMVQRQ